MSTDTRSASDAAWERMLTRAEAQRDSARRLATHAFSKLCAAEELLREAITQHDTHAAEAGLGARIQRFLQAEEATRV